MRFFAVFFLVFPAFAAFGGTTPDLYCERAQPQERIVAKAVNAQAMSYELTGEGELVVYDVFDNPIERHSFFVSAELGPEQEVQVYQGVLYHGSLMAYCVFNLDDSAYRH